mmetsp:Transcript_32307/g.55886  ORF Transcript_32307/g.55886 Transcript_32307/m.55886 type:complete len:270 (-) Transcript_32307:12-821(-)
MKLTLKDIKRKLVPTAPISTPAPVFSQEVVFDYLPVKALDLNSFKVVDGVYLVPDYIDAHTEDKVLQYGISPSTRWVDVRNRRLQMWGGTVTYQGLDNPEELPAWLKIFSRKLTQEGVFAAEPNHVLINEYQPGQGILPHTDGPAYFPLVATVSLGSPAMYVFWEQNEKRVPKFAVPVPQRSLIVFTDSAYSELLHSVEMKTRDLIVADSCGLFTDTDKGELVPVLGWRDPLETPKPTPLVCPTCGGSLNWVLNEFRSTRVSLTIRRVG